MAVAALLLVLPAQSAGFADCTITIDRSDGVVDLTDSAYLEAVNDEGINASTLTETDGIGLDRTVKMANLAQTLGAFLPRTRAQRLAGNGIKEEEVQYAVERSQSSLTYIEPEYYVAERSHNDQRRAYTRRTRSQATT
jgi:hypothetical protein